MITTELKVESHFITEYSERFPRSSGYCEDQRMIQNLVKIWRFGRVVLRRQIIDTEEVPSFAWIAHCALGSTDWKSKFAAYIK